MALGCLVDERPFAPRAGFKLDRVAPLVADPSPANSTTDADTHPMSDISDTMVNLVFGLLDKFRKIV